MESAASPNGRVVVRRYHLQERIGQGGMGTVWRAYDELLGRTIAIKEVNLPQLAEVDQAEPRERAMREARAAARLSHPNTITVHDVVEEDGNPWIVMSLVDADSLADVLRNDGPLSPTRVAEIGLAVLSALEEAHAAGILHRDVKPGNVLLGTRGRIVLTDFGIATLEGDPAMTTAAVVIAAALAGALGSPLVNGVLGGGMSEPAYNAVDFATSQLGDGARYGLIVGWLPALFAALVAGRRRSRRASPQ